MLLNSILSRSNGATAVFRVGVLSLIPLLSGVAAAQSSTDESVSTRATAPSFALTDTIPNDTATHTGVLPNGLRYFVRHNEKPEHRAEFRLVVKAGSLMEDDDQRGVAHFVEHMAFRGSTHYKGTDLVEYLKSIGVGFGNDLNANTSFLQTIYILPVPTDVPQNVTKALQVLADWAHGLTFPAKDLEDERGIILGEWRQHLGAGMRVQDQQLPVVYHGSKYPERLPIGTKESLDHLTRDQIVRFYQKWYRPDRMAIVAIGDFDVKTIEQRIRDQFSQIPAPATPLADPKFPIPPHPGTLVSVVADPELTGTNASMSYRFPNDTANTIANKRRELVRGLFDAMLNERLGDIAAKPNASFLSANVDHDELDKYVGAVDLGIAVENNGLQRGMTALLTELARVQQHGFTQAELDRQKQDVLVAAENRYTRRADRTSGGFANALIDHFLSDDPVPSAEVSRAIILQLVPAITLAEVNREIAFFAQMDNRVLAVVEPKKVGITPVDTAALLALFKTVPTQLVGEYVDEIKTTTAALLDPIPAPGKIVAEKHYPDVGITEWTLSNGITVFLKPTDFAQEQIAFAGSKPGGTSLFNDKDYPTALFLDWVSAGGWGKFSAQELERRLEGKTLSVGTNIGGTSESVQGGGTWHDLETALQLLDLQLTAPRYDSVRTLAVLQQTKAELANRSLNPEAIFQDTVQATLWPNNKRVPLVTPALLDQFNPRRAIELYRSRFADAGEFTFAFAGAFNIDSLKPLVERYIASLPAHGTKEEARDLPSFHRPRTVIKKVVTAGQEPRAVTTLTFSGPFQLTRQHSTVLQVLSSIVENRLQNRLREELAGTYGVSAGGEGSPKPISEYTFEIQFVSDPGRREELTRATFAVLDSLKRVPPSAEELQRAVNPMLTVRPRARRTNGYWLGHILSYHELGWDFKGLLDDSLLKSVTPAQVQQAAQQYLDTSRYQEFDLVPAAKKS